MKPEEGSKDPEHGSKDTVKTSPTRKSRRFSELRFGKLVGAIDEGTSSARFLIFRAGTDDIVCYHQIEVPSIYPKEGWVEQDPELIISIVKKCIEETIKELKELGGAAENIVACGITNQRESSVVWDRRTGRPLHNAIIWLDNRTTPTVEQLVSTIQEGTKDINHLKPLCGLPLSPYFSAVKLRWLRDNVPKVRQAMDEGNCMFGNIDTWLIYNFTGGNKNGGLHITDVTNASRTMLMNIKTLQWDESLLNFFGLPKSMLPEIRSSAEVYAELQLDALRGVPLTADLGDQQAALVGQQCLNKGQAKATFGTGCFLLYNTGYSTVPSKHGMLTTVGYQFGKNARPVYALEGSVAIAGAALTWLRDNLNLIESYNDVEKMARMVDDTADVYFVPAFSGLYAPYWNSEARGVICGLHENVKCEHIVRATLEAVCFQVRDILDAMKKDSGVPLAKLMVDGGMTVNKLFMQLQADLVGIEVERSKISETTALGVALAAYKVVQPTFDMEGRLSYGNRKASFRPKITVKERNARYAKWQMAVRRAIGWDERTST